MQKRKTKTVHVQEFTVDDVILEHVVHENKKKQELLLQKSTHMQDSVWIWLSFWILILLVLTGFLVYILHEEYDISRFSDLIAIWKRVKFETLYIVRK